jgi:glucose-1-phosphate thymidylyltransferase
MYGFVTSNVPSFTNYAKLFGQVATLPASVMQSTQQRMFSRRSVEQRPCDVELLYSLYELTRSEREGLEGMEES